MVFNTFTLFPEKLLEDLKIEREEKNGTKTTKVRNNVGNVEQEYEAATDLLNHMTSFIKRDHWNSTKIKVSDYVSVEQPNHQMTLFNPKPKYCISGYIFYQSKITSLRKRLAHYRLNMIDGDVNAYAQILNSE